MTALPDERLDIIRRRLLEGGRVLAAELAREFHTSEDTIRRDLRELAAAGLCRKVYGGALPVSPAFESLSNRIVQDPARKAALGACAAALVQSGQILLIDAGSTNLHIARSLPADLRVTVFTNAPAIAAELTGRGACDLVVIGGRVEPRVGGSVGARAMRDLRSLRADLCFLGACAADRSTGITAFDVEEADFKRTMIERSERIVVVLTNDKLSTVAPYGVAALSEIHDIVVEWDARPVKLDGLEAGGPRLHRGEAQSRWAGSRT